MLFRSRLLRPELLFGDQALDELGPLLLVGLDRFVQQHLADLDCGWPSLCNRVAQTWGSVRRSKQTNAGDNSRNG